MEKFPTFFPIADYWARLQGGEPQLLIWALLVFGLVVGILTGFFGGGGRFLMAPLLNTLFNVPYNVAVGSDVCQMAGNSTLNILRFKRLNSIDFKLGAWMLVGTVLGIESGAQLLEGLKKAGPFFLFGKAIPVMPVILGFIYGAILVWIGSVLYREARTGAGDMACEGFMTASPPAMTSKLQQLHIPPMISLPVSGIEAISIWMILGIGFITGLLVGFLGGGGGFIRMPALIYVIGCPMVVAIGTDLFESVFSMGYGTYSHSLKGNIDLLLVVLILISSAVGNQIGSLLARRFCHPRVRQAFAYVALLTVLLILFKLFL